jgi:YgiT-type zinc finger domain-containing protein
LSCLRKADGREIRQDFWIRGKLIVIERIPAGVCPQCGEKVVKADIGARLADFLERSKRLRKARTIRVPVIRFAEKIA